MKMRAAIYNDLKQVSLAEIEKPEVSQSGILVKNVRSGICGTDLHAYGIDGPEVGIFPGNQFGHEMSGIIDAVGANTVGFKKEQHVFINPCTFKEPTPEMSVLMCYDMAGAFAKYVPLEKPVLGYRR